MNNANDKLIQIILKQNPNSQKTVTDIVDSVKETINNEDLTILVSEADNQSATLVTRGLQIFEDMGLKEHLISLEFFGTHFSSLLYRNGITMMEQLSLTDRFKEELGYPINFL